jgi:general secretion pathway protein F
MSITFKYKAKNAGGGQESGTLQAASESVALEQLGARGWMVFKLQTVAEGVPGSTAAASTEGRPMGLWGVKKASQHDVLMAMQQLSTLLNAGLPLADALSEIAQGHRQTPIGAPLQEMYAGLRAGKSFAQVLQVAQLETPQYVVELVRAGEETGKLAQSMASCVQQMAADADFVRETRNALTYPMVLVFSGILASLVVFVFVVPKFASFLTHPKADIPAFSRWVLQAGLWLVQNKLMASAIAAGVVVSAILALKQRSVREAIWNTAAQLPLSGRWIGQIELGRWASMLSVLLHNRVPLLDALRHSRNSLSTNHRRIQADLAFKAVQGGQALAKALEAQRFLDSVGLNLVRVGEQSGKLAETVQSLGDIHRNAARQTMKQFLVLLEPVTILLVSVFLGGIMISVMMAITSLTNVI